MNRILGYFFLMVFLVLTSFVPFSVIDNSLEVWIDHTTQEGKRWQEFVKEFGSSEFIVIGVKSSVDPFQKNILEQILSLEDRLEKVQQVQSVVGPGRIYRELFQDKSIVDFQKEMLDSPFYQNLIVGKDQKTLGIFLYLKKLPAIPTARKEITQAVEREIALSKNSQLDFAVVGPPILNAHLDRASQSSSQKLVPACILIVFFWMILMVRSWWSSLVVLFTMALSIGATIGLMVVFRTPLNMLTIAMPGLLLVLSITNAVHIVHRFQELSHILQDRGKAISLAMQELSMPCIGASITTCVGFLSLMVSSMPAVKQLGIFTAAGLLFGLVANLYLVPWFLNVRWNSAPGHASFLSIPAMKFAIYSYKHYMLVNAVAIALFILALWVSSFYQIEANTLKFLPEEHPVVQDSQFISENLTGLYSLDLEIHIEKEKEIPWHWLEKISRDLEKNPAVARVYGPTDLLKKMNSIASDNPKDYQLPESKEAIDLMIVSMEKMILQEWHRICKDNENRIRISVLVKAMSSHIYKSIFDDINNIIASRPSFIEINTTGIITLLIQSEKDLIYTQMESFGISAVIICIMLAFFLKKKAMILSSIPDNILPPLASFAIMVALGIKVNTGTVIVASIAIGLAVDNTIHICRRLNSILPEKNNLEEAMIETLKIAGSPMIASSLIVSIGFTALLLADFRPLIYFGGLTIVAIFVALVCDLVWLPALLRLLMQKK